MPHRPKAQGTALESALVASARAVGLVARRLAEGGSTDEGDVEIHDAAGDRWVVECKARAALSLHPALAKAQRKCPDARVAVLWKRLLRVEGQKRRVAAGPPLVAMPLTDYLDLLRRAGVAEEEVA